MKQAVGCGWITRLSGIVLVTMLALPSYAQLMLAHEGHHDASGCTIETGEFTVTFAAYEVPEGGLPPMHAFCQSIPKLGKVNLSIELTDRSSREIPLAVRLVKDGHEGHGGGDHGAEAEPDVVSSDEDEHAGHDVDEHSGHDDHGEMEVSVSEHGLVYMPVQKHNSGIISVVADIQEKGDYAVLLERHDDDGSVTVAVRIPFSIGGGGHGGHGGGFGLLEIILLLAAAGGGYYYYMQRKKTAEASDKS